METWRSIPNYEGIYEISNLGNIKSIDRYEIQSNGIKRFRKGRILKLSLDKYGYNRVELNKNSISKLCLIHRLVAETFIPNPLNLPQVNHKDEDKTNNQVDNLEWCTRDYNNAFGTRTKRISKKLSKKVYQYDLNLNFLKEWPSTKECDNYGFISKHISACCIGKRKTHKGYIWSYSKI